MKRAGNLKEKLLSDENLAKAIDEVIKNHHWFKNHRPNQCAAWLDETRRERIPELRQILLDGFEPAPSRKVEIWDFSARKARTIHEPKLWPDQCIHHALVQVLQPVMMRGMDPYCCGSIRGRGSGLAVKAIQSWMDQDRAGTAYELTADIYHFYDSLTAVTVMKRMRCLVKDSFVLDLIERVLRDGVLIGYYPSQWFANTALQPLDNLIRQSGCRVSHYMRYMDNLHIFGPNRRKLKKLQKLIADWLAENGLRLKTDWQVFKVSAREEKQPLREPRRGYTRPRRRLPDAVGYRYGRGYTLIRKHTFLRAKRGAARVRRRIRQHRPIPPQMAASLQARLGQFAHCSNRNLYRYLFRGMKVQKQIKAAIRAARRRNIKWSIYLAQRARSRCSAPRAQPIQISPGSTR